MKYTKQHTSENIKRELSAIIRELKDPRLKESFISIAKIEVSEKNSACKVFISSLDGYNFAVDAAKCLQNAVGFIRKTLSERISLRYTPIISFIPTSSLEDGAKILEKLNNLNLESSIKK